MTKDCMNRYKACRENALYTQVRASELLNISEHTLSNYENDRSKVPDEIVAAMAELYDAPLLAWWHLRENNVLGKFLPEVIMPQTHGDMVFQLLLSQDDLSYAFQSMKEILADGEVDSNEREAFTANIKMMKVSSGRLCSAVAYAEQIDKALQEEGEIGQHAAICNAG